MGCLEFDALEKKVISVNPYRLLVDVAACIFNSPLLDIILWLVVSRKLDHLSVTRHDGSAITNIRHIAPIIHEHDHKCTGSRAISARLTVL
jgi:hypothetical protein